MPRWLAMLIFASLAVTAWVSRGVLALAGPGPDSARIGILPPLADLAILLAIAFAAALSRRWTMRMWWPAAVALVLLLPWVPGSVPPAFLIWTGAASTLVWIAIGLAIVLPAAAVRERLSKTGWLIDPARAPIVAAALAFAAFVAAAAYLRPVLPVGDEPHYLVMTQSLLLDGDLKIENNHRRGDYRVYFPNELRPDYLRRGADGEIYSIHAPGLSVLVLPAYALFGYTGTRVFLALVASLAAALAWTVGWRVSGSATAAWFGWAAVVLSPPFFFHAFTIYPDGPGAALTLTGVAALVAAPRIGLVRWSLHGAALAALPWLHTRYALVAGALGLLLIARLWTRPNRWRSSAAFLAVPLASAAGWLGFFQAIYGELDPAAPYGGYTQSAVAHVATGLPGLLFDQQFGLVANAPVYLLALPGCWCLLANRRARAGLPRLALELAVITGPYLVLASAYRMWWGGSSAPARFATPVLLAFAIPLAVLWSRLERPASRAFAAAALTISLGLTAILTLGQDGFLLYNVRDGYARWLDWVGPLADLPLAMPSYFRSAREPATLEAGIWIGVGLAAWTLVNEMERRARWPRELVALATLVALALTVMVASTAVWRRGGGPRLKIAPSQLPLLEAAARSAGSTAVEFRPLRLVPLASVPPRLVIPTFDRAARPPADAEAASESRLDLPWLPAGVYRLSASGRAAAPALVRAGRSPSPIHEVPLVGQLGATRAPEFELPVAVRSVVVTVATPARPLRLTLQPVSAGDRLGLEADAIAWQTARYGPTAVYSLDHRTMMEAAGMWLLGGTEGRIVVQADQSRASVSLFVRNGAAANQCTLTSGGWRAALDLGPREERLIELPIDPALGSVVVRLASARGFRPSEIEPGNADSRYLGCWLEVR